MMNISNVVLVLGKRLVNNCLTEEGRSRVAVLPQVLESLNLEQSAVIFCGGATDGQTQTEAQAMFNHFKQINQGELPPNIILEGQSTNTIENIRHAADKLIASQLCQQGQQVNVVFVSNDYHLKRIFEIQTLMVEQGLLRTLKARCADSGLILNISDSLDDHFAVPYPHSSLNGQVFLLLDEMTTYRVYLEGVKSRAFTRPLDEVRKVPYELIQKVLGKLQQILIETDATDALKCIESAVESTCPTATMEDVIHQLFRLNETLIHLNRCYDPEGNQPQSIQKQRR